MCKSITTKESETKHGPWSLRAVNIIEPVSSPTRHSAMRENRGWARDSTTFDVEDRLARAFTGTSFELTTFTVRLCPLVPGWRRSTFVNTGFLFSGTAAAVACFGAYVDCLGAALALLAITRRNRWEMHENWGTPARVWRRWRRWYKERCDGRNGRRVVNFCRVSGYLFKKVKPNGLFWQVVETIYSSLPILLCIWNYSPKTFI